MGQTSIKSMFIAFVNKSCLAYR